MYFAIKITVFKVLRKININIFSIPFMKHFTRNYPRLVTVHAKALSFNIK